MDISTILGVIAFGALVIVGYDSQQLPPVLLNSHGAVVVVGGTLIAMLLNTPFSLLGAAFKAVLGMFTDPNATSPGKLVPLMVDLAEQCRTRGLSALQDARDERAVEGFLGRAATTAVEYNDPELVRDVLEKEISQWAERSTEIANVYRSMSVLAPMFGLLGTLIGIIGVLKDLSNPESVGPAMAIAITSAFYGILLANMVCVPIAGKMRARTWLGMKNRMIVLDGILEIMKGSVPLIVERKLQAHL